MSPSLLITVDTELTWFPDAQGLWGRVGHKEYGLHHILDVFDELNIKATFFLDVYGKKEQDVSEQRKAGELIAGKAQDLQLHTHPAPTFDHKRRMLNEYSLAEQEDILAFGRNRIQKWTGCLATVHRAGSWAANNDTLVALKRLGFLGDFSGCLWGRHCDIERQLIDGNGWARINGIVCGVGTCYRDRLTRRIRRIDLGGCSFVEVREMLAKRIDPLFLTLHSFSFLKYNKTRTRFGYAGDYVSRFRHFCQMATTQHGYAIVTANDMVVQLTRLSDDELRWGRMPTSSYLSSFGGIVKSALDRLSP